jgi:hypothetical protein
MTVKSYTEYRTSSGWSYDIDFKSDGVFHTIGEDDGCYIEEQLNKHYPDSDWIKLYDDDNDEFILLKIE